MSRWISTRARSALGGLDEARIKEAEAKWAAESEDESTEGNHNETAYSSESARMTPENITLNCFVIMPFSQEFDDVYTTIKDCVEGATSSVGRCFRLDENQPAGRITERLLRELSSTSFCVADLTGNKPNVMWELGYAMALGRPTIIVTQQRADVPFDIHDMHSLEYDRNRLTRTLSTPLRQVVIDTVAALGTEPAKTQQDGIAVDQLRNEIAELKEMVAQVVRTWNPVPQPQATAAQQKDELSNLQGAWITGETHSHIYAKIVNDELIAPYCYEGNEDLTGVYYGFRKAGEYWFARFAWLDGSISGFAFVKEESADFLSGAWWDDQDYPLTHDSPPEKHGVRATWKRRQTTEVPSWASKFIDKVERDGLPSVLQDP